MAVILNADNGAVSGISGLTTTADSSGVLQFQSSGTNTLTITTAGNVGIGTSSPTNTLTVATTVDDFGITVQSTGGDGAVYISNNNASEIAAANKGGAVQFAGLWNTTAPASTRTFGQVAGYKENSTDANQQGYLSFSSRPASGALVERMRIDSDGNVGIGVTPSAWNANWDVLETPTAAFASYNTSDPTTILSSNAYISTTSSTTGSIYKNTGYASMYRQSQGAHNWFIAPSGTAGNAITFTEKVRIDTDGLKFNGDTAAANALDDYEEGTFTPAVEGTTTAGTGTYNSRLGRYVKIGKVAFIQIWINMTSHTGTGNMIITGLPFATVNVSGINPSVNFSRVGSLTLPANSIIAGYCNQNVTSIILNSRSTAGGSTTDAALALDTNFTVGISLTYETA
jgi:hypothetical protein